MTLAEQILALDRSLRNAGIPHAFGGAIALAYWTLDPRGTSDIDLNLFVPSSRSRDVLGALPEQVKVPRGTLAAIDRDGQVRLFWDRTPIDLFFENLPVHRDAAENSTTVPFEGERIPVLGPVELVVFKAMFDRTRDWADIEAVAAAGTADFDAVRGTLATLVGPDDDRFRRLEAAITRAAEERGSPLWAEPGEPD